ncbi:MAG: hypothetical protein M0T77_07695 [Actinomycetota bacterium]|nr:hypothetical protein [Actinomycetota bacterium]
MATVTSRTLRLRLGAIKSFLAYWSYEDIALVTASQQANALHAPASPSKPMPADHAEPVSLEHPGELLEWLEVA